MEKTDEGIERGGADCYYFINDNENPDFSDVFPVEDEDEGRELYNAIIESMIEKYEGWMYHGGSWEPLFYCKKKEDLPVWAALYATMSRGKTSVKVSAWKERPQSHHSHANL